MPTVNKVLIVGGGIGGLSSGIALAKNGCSVTIAELHKEFNVYGVGIIQPANALRALDALGLAEEALRRGSPYGMVKMCTAAGHVFTEVGVPSIGRLPSHNGISRRILHEILYEEAVKQGVVFRMGTSVAAIENKGEEVSVQFTDDSTGTYDLLIGADGINSKVRSLVFGNYKPRYTNESVWRYPFKRLPELETGYMFMGRHSKAGLIPMTADTMYMFLVTSEGEDNPFIPEHELVPRMRAWLGEYSAPMIKKVVDEITDPKKVVYRPLEVLFVPAPWYENRVVLIGDAVHATIPQLGQGAGLALEDSIVLAELLQKESEVEEALHKFMDRRLARCKMVVDTSVQLGELEQLDWKGRLPEGTNLGAIIGKASAAMMQPI
ncbi:FAD-dependent monooxygenase [Chitinophagaceae bacterium LB-8]|uniref:FAD-dependent monooxygenase n=1 Tax=Paraflavisolibacter caeni TaxID=2982496 RepID=A0A9X3BFV9_9BACT|nr:FAD-dependent monooxygenase [Paraflavisolibacter caeni]MCU7549759.1 FAD-dependent monooxygenase [Paraflavisolibacter caeni]